MTEDDSRSSRRTNNNKLTEQAQKLSEFVIMVNSGARPQQIEGIIGIRKLISVEKAPPIQEVMNSGVVVTILNLMKNDTDTLLQAEGAWILTNICSGTTQHVKYILQLGALDALIKLLNAESYETVDQVIWAIGNIAGDCVQFRDICLKRSCMEKVIAAMVRFNGNVGITRNAVWVISNLSRGKPAPNWKYVSAALPVLVQIISNKANSTDEYFTDALWALSYITDSNLQESINSGCVPPLIECINSDNPRILTPAIRALGNLVSGDEAQTKTVLDHRTFLPRLFELASHQKKALRKEVFWIMSNITAGTSEQIAQILNQENYMNMIKKVVATDAQEVADEASWAITNMLTGATNEQMSKLINNYDCVKSLGIILNNAKSNIKQEALNGLLQVLKWGETNSAEEFCKQQFLIEQIPEKVYALDTLDHVDEIMAFFEDVEGLKLEKKPESQTFTKGTDEIRKVVQGKEYRNNQADEGEDDEEEEEGEEEEEEEDNEEDEDEDEEECNNLNENVPDEVKEAKKAQNIQKDD